ncbi:Fc.00g018220.m01.CDS01 [Cosmosporella sp. VM-42]
MSSDQQVKKRRLEGLETPKAVSAISAIAARRRGAASAAVSTTSTPEPEDRPSTGNVNFFSPLKQYGSQNGTPKSPGKGVLKQPRPLRGSNSPAIRPNTTKSPRSISGTQEAPDATSTVSTSRAIQYSSFRPTKRNHRTKAGGVVELRLENSERFLVLGSFGIRVLHGEVTMSGALLRPSETMHWVHAPHCHALPVLRTADNTGLELYPDPSARGLRQLGRISPLFRRMWNEPPDSVTRKRSDKMTFQILCTSEDAPNRCIIQDLVSPAEWNRKLSALVSAARKKSSWITLVCGPKSAGKSTFSKLLTNRLLTDRPLGQNSPGVVVLDLDPGQPEYAPAGTLSLVHVTQPNLGTPFTHPGAHETANRAIRCHALASVTPASDPELYLACATDLYGTYKKSLPDSPLIINTPGWILGTGLDLLSEVISNTEPDEVLYMSEEGPSETVEMLQGATKTMFTELPSQQSEFTSRTAAHLRAMQTMSYFHLDDATQRAHGADGIKSRLSWNPSPLSTIHPWLIRYSGPRPGVLGILSYDYQSPPELLAETINGMVLAAVEIEDPNAFRNLAADSMDHDAVDRQGAIPTVLRTPEGLAYIPNHTDSTLDPRHSHTIGLVLIRGIDTKSQTLQILTPISLDRIKDIKSRGRDIVLVHGKFDAPNWAYTEDLYQRADNDEGNDGGIEITDEDTSEDDSDAEPEAVEKVSDIAAVPWIEILKRNEKRPVGSRVWRVRRDLGRNASD